MRVGVVGLGKMGLLHSSILNALPSVRVAALCDKSFIMRRIAKRIMKDVKVTDDYEELGESDLDAAYVTTPISSHFLIVKNMLAKGLARNFFVEKTLASDFSQAEELCKLAENCGTVNMVGYMKRFAVTFREAKILLDKEALGVLSSFNAYAYSSDFFPLEKSQRASFSRGGALRDSGCHVVDLALWFFGDLKVKSVKLPLGTEIGAETSLQFKVERLDGMEGEFNVSQCMENYRMPEMGLSIRGSKGVIQVNDDRIDLEIKEGKSFTWHRHDLDDNVGFWVGAPEYFREDEHFVKSMVSGYDAEPSFRTASKVDDIIDQVRLRSRSG